jgi:hypothetical protein
MKAPTRQDTINLRVWHRDGHESDARHRRQHHYPLAVHRPITEFEDMNDGYRNRYSGRWCITHIPTGKSFGINSKDFKGIMEYVNVVKHHPVMLMITDETMTGHPMYGELVTLHNKTRGAWGL